MEVPTATLDAVKETVTSHSSPEAQQIPADQIDATFKSQYTGKRSHPTSQPILL